MKKIIKSKTILQTAIVVCSSIFVVAGVVGAATTIGTNIITGGTLSVTGTSSLGIINTGVWNGTDIDISDYTNLAVANNLSLTGDTVGVATGYALPATTSIANWNTAYGWGNHASIGYLTAVEIATNTDLAVTDNLALEGAGETIGVAAGYEIPLTASTTEWATAFGWGNHATAGYLSAESDPLFMAASSSFVTTESDPIAGAITGIIAADGAGNFSAVTNNAANWNTAYGWGNHATAGYLSAESDPLFMAASSSFVTAEADPIFTAHEAFNITVASTTNWTTAFGWGNHASAGYLLATSTTDLYMSGNQITNVGFLGVSGQLGVSGNAVVGDLQVSSSTNATSTLTVGMLGGSAACLKFQDTDLAGWTYCSVLDGVMTCGTVSCE